MHIFQHQLTGFKLFDTRCRQNCDWLYSKVDSALTLALKVLHMRIVTISSCTNDQAEFYCVNACGLWCCTLLTLAVRADQQLTEPAAYAFIPKAADARAQPAWSMIGCTVTHGHAV